MSTMVTYSNGNIFRVTCSFLNGIHRSPVVTLHKGQWRVSFGVFFDVRLSKHLNKQWRCRWFETSWCCPCDVTVMTNGTILSWTRCSCSQVPLQYSYSPSALIVAKALLTFDFSSKWDANFCPYFSSTFLPSIAFSEWRPQQESLEFGTDSSEKITAHYDHAFAIKPHRSCQFRFLNTLNYHC